MTPWITIKFNLEGVFYILISFCISIIIVVILNVIEFMYSDNIGINEMFTTHLRLTIDYLIVLAISIVGLVFNIRKWIREKKED